MADYIFDDWKKILDDFQNCVKKDLEEIHTHKVEVQKMKAEILKELQGGKFYRDDRRIIISAPEIIIGNVDRSGDLLAGAGNVVIKGNNVSLDGVGSEGQIMTRAPRIVQKAVDPGTDGLENVVCPISEVVSQAGSIVLHSSDSKDVFSQMPVVADRGGVSIHADTHLQLEAAISGDKRKEEIEDSVKTYTGQIADLEKMMAEQKKNVEGCFKRVQKLLDKQDEFNDSDIMSARLNTVDMADLHKQLGSELPLLYDTTVSFIRSVSQLAELNRSKKALETEKEGVKTGDDYKNNSTGSSMSIVSEQIFMATADGDGNLHTQPGAGISIKTPYVDVTMSNDKGELVEGSAFEVNSENITFSTMKPSTDGKELPVVGNVSILSKNIDLQAIDYQMKDNIANEKALTADGKISMTAKNVEVSTCNPANLERDDNGKLTKGEYKAEGDVIVKSKTFTVESLDYEVADGKLKTKALTKDGKIDVRSEKMNFLAADAEGKATGSINMNAKAVAVKSMDVDKEKLTDSALAAGSTMTLVSEKMYVGSKSKDIKSKKLQAVSEELGAFADKTLEIQQGDGKALVQLSGGNASVGGSKTQVYGDTTINAKAEVKGELKAPKATIDNIQAKSSFKSPNISDGMAMGAGGGGGSLSAKLKTEDAPKE